MARAAALDTTPEMTRPSLTFRLIVIGIISFLTLVDLFAAQAILPSLTKAYGVTPAQMGFAVNASTLGMAAAGIVIAFLASKINRRHGIWISLALLAVPTTLLGTMPDLTTFTWLRIAQGVCMASAFTLTMAYLAEQYSASEVASALAAYVTGNVACNLAGRLLSASLASSFGLEINFYVFAALNLAGAVLVFFTLQKMTPMNGMMMCLTNDSMILPNAAPMITPTARSITFPLKAKFLNSSNSEKACLDGTNDAAFFSEST